LLHHVHISSILSALSVFLTTHITHSHSTLSFTSQYQQQYRTFTMPVSTAASSVESGIIETASAVQIMSFQKNTARPVLTPDKDATSRWAQNTSLSPSAISRPQTPPGRSIPPVSNMASPSCRTIRQGPSTFDTDNWKPVALTTATSDNTSLPVPKSRVPRSAAIDQKRQGMCWDSTITPPTKAD